MKMLRELYDLAGKKAVLKLLSRGKETSLTEQFLELLEDPDLTDDQAVGLLYGHSAKKSLAAYKSLKTRMRDVMIQAIQTDRIIEPNYSSYNDAYQSGFRQLDVVRVLAINRAYTAAKNIARHTYHRVEEYEIISLNHALADNLASMYLGAGYNEKLFNKYNDLSRYYGKAAHTEALLKDKYRIIRNMTYAHRKSFPEIGRLALAFAQEFSYVKTDYPKVSILQGMVSNLEVTGHMYSGDYRKTIRASEEGENILSNCKGANDNLINVLRFTRLECTLKMEDFVEGKSQITQVSEKMIPNSINSIKVVEYAIRLGLRTANFDYAYLALANLNRRKINKLLTPRHHEYWMIFEAYVNFLVRAGEIKPKPEWPQLPKFRFAKFFNNVPSYSRNKMGMNIPILVLQALYFIVEKKFGEVIDRTEALERYCSRYLRNDENLRNNCFFKLLLITTQGQFHRLAVERKSGATFSRMISDEARLKSQGNDTEIIPYEYLWKVLLNHLEGGSAVAAS